VFSSATRFSATPSAHAPQDLGPVTALLQHWGAPAAAVQAIEAVSA